MTRATFTRMLIGASGVIAGASLVLVLQGAALAGAQRLVAEQARSRSTAPAMARETRSPTQDVAAADTAQSISYPRM